MVCRSAADERAAVQGFRPMNHALVRTALQQFFAGIDVKYRDDKAVQLVAYLRGRQWVIHTTGRTEEEAFTLMMIEFRGRLHARRLCGDKRPPGSFASDDWPWVFRAVEEILNQLPDPRKFEEMQ